VLDELQIHQIPVLLGRGRRLFEKRPSRIELEIVRVIDAPEAIHIRYRVRLIHVPTTSEPAAEGAA
jgi:dihydrofolate reductase